MSKPTTPVLSVVIIAFSQSGKVGQCITSLMSQPRFDELEIHIIYNVAGLREIEPFSEVDNIHWHEVASIETVPSMRSLGITRAGAQLVALLECDCSVGPDWLTTLLHAHRDNYPAVGGAVEPGQYTRGIDWAIFYCEYARFMAPWSGVVAALPGNNVSYRADILESAAKDSGFFDVFFNESLQLAGQQLIAAEGMLVINDNRRRLSECVFTPFHHGRAFAARRFNSEHRARQVLYAVLTPLLPIVKTVRTLSEITARKRPELPIARALPWMVLFHCCWSAGECLGYLLGPGDSDNKWA